MRNILTLILTLLLAVPANATVVNSSRTQSFSPGSDTTVFTITNFHFTAANQLKVTKVTEATSFEDVLTLGVDYSVTLPFGTASGYITTTVAVTSAYTIDIERRIPLTQTTSFISQGSYSAKRHEDAFDKLTMIAQQLQVAGGTDGTEAVEDHVAEANPHTQYVLIDGASGGQEIDGGTGSGESLVLSSTEHATKGYILLGTNSAYDEVNDRLGINDTTPDAELDVVGDTLISGDLEIGEGLCVGFDCTPEADVLQIGASEFQLRHSTGGSNSNIIRFDGSDTLVDYTLSTNVFQWYINTTNVFDWKETSVDFKSGVSVGINDTTPDYDLDVEGEVSVDGEGVFEGFNDAVGSESSISFHKETDVGVLNISVADTIGNVENAGYAWINLYSNAFGTGAFQNLIGINAPNGVLVDNMGTGEQFIVDGDGEFQGELSYGSTVEDVGNFTADFDNCGGTITTDNNGVTITLPDTTATSGLGIDGFPNGCRIRVFLTGTDGSTTVKIQTNATSGEAMVGHCITETPSMVTIGGVDIDITSTNQNQGDRVLFTYDSTNSIWWISDCLGVWS